MKVIADGPFAIYVYPNEHNQPHHSPHCHIRWSGLDAVVLLPTMTQIIGPAIPKKGIRLLRDNIEVICNEWDKINPESKN